VVGCLISYCRKQGEEKKEGKKIKAFDIFPNRKGILIMAAQTRIKWISTSIVLLLMLGFIF